MKRSYKTISAIVLAAALLLSGCSENSSSRRRDREESANEPVVTELASVRSEDANYLNGMTYDYDYEYAAEEAYDAAPMDAGAGSTSVGSQEVTVDPGSATTDRMLIRYVTISCETLNFTEFTSNIESRIAQMGGYIESKTFSGTGNAGDLRTASYTIRLTSEDLDELVGTIGNASIITSSNENTEDVTLSYADTQARVESLRTEQETLNNLLAQADDLDIILQLQNELTYVRYQIESYESQLRVLENLSSYSTLTLHVSEVLEEVEPEEPHVKTFGEKVSESFHNGLEEAKEYFQDLAIDAAGNVIPLSVTIVLIIAAVITVVVVIKKRKRKAAASASLSKSPVKTEENKTEDSAENK